MALIIDSDQHLYECRTMWTDHIDPALRDDALAIVDDELGYPWLTWRGRRLDMADVQFPGDTAALGRQRERRRQGPAARVRLRRGTARRTTGSRRPGSSSSPRWASTRPSCSRTSACCGSAGSRRRCPPSPPTWRAWNRWCATVVADGGGRLHPVAHLTLRDPDWLDAQLAELAAAGVRLAMIAPAAVDGRPLSHPDHDRMWSAFVEHGDHAGVPRRRPAPRARRGLLHRPRRQLRPGARVGVPLGAAGDRGDRPDRQRRVRTTPGAPHRDRRAVVDLGARSTC